MTTTSNHTRDYFTLPLRLAFALSFLFSVADRLGLLGTAGTPGVAWGNFTNFLAYNAQANSFVSASVRPLLGIVATCLEGLLGAALLLGIRTQMAALCSGALLLLFGTAMAISFGIKSPFDYSVFSAMGGALLLAAWNAYPLSVDSLIDLVMIKAGAGRLSLHFTVVSQGGLTAMKILSSLWRRDENDLGCRHFLYRH